MRLRFMAANTMFDDIAVDRLIDVSGVVRQFIIWRARSRVRADHPTTDSTTTSRGSVSCECDV